MNQLQIVKSLVVTLETNIVVLTYAQNIATAIISGPANHCAGTLSALLVFGGIYPTGSFDGQGDLESRVVNLAHDLQNRRGWTQVLLGKPIEVGDVGVVILASGTHHIYLVIDSTDQARPLIADNQAPQLHIRTVAGDPAQNQSPTTFFLRPPIT